MFSIDFFVRPEQNTNFSPIDTHAIIKTLILILKILINEVANVF